MEDWKDIKGYEGNYQVSSMGNVKSLKFKSEKILTSSPVGPKRRQYFSLDLSINGNKKNIRVHRLVAFHFVDNPEDKPQINHIDNDPLNNKADNLEWCTPRENTTHGFLLKKTSSNYTGVSWYKPYGKWHCRIYINGKRKHLGYFLCELEAAKAYNQALNQISDQ